MSEKITAESRTEFGKGAARRIRRDNKVPAVIYGHGGEPQHVTLPGHDTMMALKRGGSNALLELDVDGTTTLALTKQVQVDPIRRVLEHIDFVVVRKGEKVTVDIQIHVVGEAGPDTLVVTENQTVEVEAEATNIPESIEISIEGLPAGTQILASDLTLPEGSTLLLDPETLIINITETMSAEALEAVLEEAEAEAGIEREVSTEEIAEAQVEAKAEDAKVDSAGGVSDSLPWLVVGLGNPGPTYAGHRHNVGYLVTDELAGRLGPVPRTGPWRRHKTGRAEVVEGRLGSPGAAGPRIVLARPRSFMNEVGGPVKALASFYQVPPERIVAIHDELDIAFGTLRVKLGGGDNGHNGLKSMRSSLGTGDFYRVRAGIGRPPGRQEVADFVLSNYAKVELKELPFQVDSAADAVECLLTEGLERTQQRFNS